MKLLEFNKDDGGANPRRPSRSPQHHKTLAKAPPARAAGPQRPAIPPKAPKPDRALVYPLAGNALRKLRNSPVDLEQLQQRIDFIERHLQDESRKTDQHARTRDLEKLKQRMKRLECSLEDELTNARQREERMLAALNKPPLMTVIRERLIYFRREELPVILDWSKRAAKSWWADSQPCWWPQFYRAWQEALDKARR